MPVAGSGEQNERHVLESTKRPLVHRAALGQGPVGELLELDANAIIASKNLFRPRSELVGDLELDSLRMQDIRLHLTLRFDHAIVTVTGIVDGILVPLLLPPSTGGGGIKGFSSTTGDANCSQLKEWHLQSRKSGGRRRGRREERSRRRGKASALGCRGPAVTRRADRREN